MSYVEQTLASDESIIQRARFNWTYSFWHVFFFLISFVPGMVFGWGQFGLGRSFSDLAMGYGISGVAAMLGCLILLVHMVHLWTTEIAVTNYRFIYKTGLISRETKEVNLSNIEEVNLHQSVPGRIFGYGKLILRGTGVGVIELPNIDNPIELRRTIENARANRRRDRNAQSMTATADAAPQGAKDDFELDTLDGAPAAPKRGGGLAARAQGRGSKRGRK